MKANLDAGHLAALASGGRWASRYSYLSCAITAIYQMEVLRQIGRPQKP